MPFVDKCIHRNYANVSIVIMQSKINNKVQIGQALNPLKNAAKLSSINNTSDLKDVFTK